MKSNSLLSQLTNLEGQLNHFSFEELTSEEASSLKKSFMSFKYRLEEKVLGPNPNVFNSRTNNRDFELAIGNKELTKPVKGLTKLEEGRLMANLGDAVKKPINGILETIDLLKDGQLNEEQQLRINSIASSSNHLLDIINELLEYNKLISGKEKFENINFNFYTIIWDTIYLCNTLIINNKVSLEVEMDTDIPEILKGDPSKLSQILLTLLGNSIKQVDEGGILLKIKLRRQDTKKLVLDFEIRDLHNEVLIKDHRPNSSDLGIGFAMVEGILEILKGSLTTMETLNEGCVHKFTIPYEKSEGITESGNRTDSILVKEHSTLEGLHIVVLESNILIRKLMEQRLKNWGCTVHITDNAHAGLDYLLQNRVDIVLMDLGRPAMNGFQIVRVIRESGNNHIKNLPIIAFTDDFSTNVKNKCFTLGIDHCILKPYSQDELLSVLRKYKSSNEGKPIFNTDPGPASLAENKEVWKVCLSSVLEECMGEINLLEELIALFKQNMLDFIGRANVYIPEGNFNGLGFAAHKVKIGLSMMKADYIFSLVEKITDGCRTHRNLPEIGRLYDQLLLAYPMVEKAIDTELMILKSKGD